MSMISKQFQRFSRFTKLSNYESYLNITAPLLRSPSTKQQHCTRTSDQYSRVANITYTRFFSRISFEIFIICIHCNFWKIILLPDASLINRLIGETIDLSRRYEPMPANAVFLLLFFFFIVKWMHLKCILRIIRCWVRASSLRSSNV